MPDPDRSPRIGAAQLAEAARRKPESVPCLIAGVAAKSARARFGAAKALQLLSSRSPELLYPHFDFFAAMLGHPNRILQWNAIRTLAGLAPVDAGGKLELILEPYLALIEGPVMISAAHAMHGAACIGVAKPNLAPRIARRILRVEHAGYATPECRNVAIGHALQALGTLRAALPSTRAIRNFAARHLDNRRPATAAKANALWKALSQPAKTTG
jgi:hypothetical protein